MKRILSIIAALLLITAANGQFTKSGGTLLRTGSSFMAVAEEPTPDFYDEYDIIYAAFATKPHDTIADLQEALVYSLDTAGYWARMDYFSVAAHQYEDGTLINWINPVLNDATNVSSTAWTQFVGYNGDGSADYINTNWNPSTDGINFSQDDCSIGIFLMENIQEDNVYVFGAYEGTHQTYFRPYSTTGGLGGAISSNATFAAAGVTDARGLWIVTRTASNATAVYQNRTTMDTDTDASTGLPNSSMGILNRIGANGYSSNTYAIFFAMDGVNQTEADEISEILNAYITSISE